MNCPACGKPVRRADEECGACGFPLNRLCPCGTSYHGGLGRCPACHVPAFENHVRARPKPTSGTTTKDLEPTVRVLPCPACGRVTVEGSETCDHCGESLHILCACGTIFLASQRPVCPSCERVPGPERKRTPRARIRRVVVLVSMVILIAGGGAFWVFGRQAGPNGPELFEVGRQRIQDEQFEEALPFLQKAVAIMPWHRRAGFSLAYTLHQVGRTAEAEVELRRILELEKGMDEALLLLGEILEARGDLDEARALYRRSISDARKPVRAYRLLAEMGRRRSDSRLVLEALEGEARADHDSPLIMLKLAEAYMQHYRLERDERLRSKVGVYLRQCLARCDVALLGRPEQPILDLLRARALVRRELWGFERGVLGHAEAARRRAGDVPGSDLVDAEIRWATASGMDARGDHEAARQRRQEAAESMREIVRGAATFDEALEAVLLVRLEGATEVVLDLLATARESWPDARAPWLLAAETLLGQARMDDASALLEEAREAGHVMPRLLMLAHLMRGDWSGALAEAERLRSEGARTRDVAAFEVIARCERARLDPDRFEEDLRVARDLLGGRPGEIETEDPHWLRAHGRVLILGAESRADLERGVTLLAEAHDRNPRDLLTGLWLVRGQVALHREGDSRIPEAMRTLERIVKAAPGWLDARSLLAQVALLDGRTALAIDLARSILEEDPSLRSVRFCLARAYVQRGGDLEEEAIRELEKLCNEDPAAIDTRLLLGRLYLRRRRPGLTRAVFSEAEKAARDAADRQHVIEAVAEVYRSEGYDDEALESLERLVEDDPESMARRFTYVDMLVAMGHHDLALAALRELRERDLTSVSIVRRICEVHFDRGRDDPEVARLLRDLRQREPGSMDLLYLESVRRCVHAQTMRRDRPTEAADELVREAARDLSRYVKARPDDPRGHYAVGMARILLGDLDGAAEALAASRDRGGRGSALREAFLMVQGARAERMMRGGRVEDAVDLLLGVVNAQPSADVPRKHLASGLLHMGRLADTEAEIRAILRRAPDDPDAWMLMGLLRQRQGKLRESVSALEEAVKHAPDNPVALYLLAGVLIESGRPEQALLRLREAVKLVPASKALARLLLETLLDARQFEEAWTLADERVTDDPGDSLGEELKGRYHMRRAEYAAAETALRGAVKNDPGSVPALSLLVELLAERRNDMAAAIAVVREALSNRPDDPGILFVLGRCQILAYRGVTDEEFEAVDTFRRVLDLDPTNYAARLQVVKWELFQNRLESAHRALAPVLHMAEWRHEVAMWEAQIQARLGADSEAEKYYRMVLAIRPDHGTALNNLAWILGTERDPEGLELINRALEATPKEPDRLDTLGYVLSRLGRIREAVEAYESARTLYRERIALLERRGRDREGFAPHVRAKLRGQAKLVSRNLAELESRLAALER